MFSVIYFLFAHILYVLNSENLYFNLFKHNYKLSSKIKQENICPNVVLIQKTECLVDTVILYALRISV